MSEIRFTREHEWVAVEGDIATIGISDHAQHALGDVVYVELPDVGKPIAKGEAVAVVESVKAASDVYAPVGGTVIAANSAIVEQPGLVNQAAEADGWFVKLRLDAPLETAELMDRPAYETFIADPS